MELKLVLCVILGLAAMLAGAAEGRTVAEDEAVRAAVVAMTRDSRPYRLPPTTSAGRGNGSALNLGVSFEVTTVHDVNAKKGHVDMEGYLRLNWRDSRLRFNFRNASPTYVRINPKLIWTPDIELFNAVFPGVQRVNDHSMALVSASGDVMLINKFRTRFDCDIIGQMPARPSINCTMTFGSWTYNGNDIMPSTDATPSSIISNFKLSGMWKVTDATAWVEEKMYDCCPESYPNVKFSFNLRRRNDV